MTRRLALVALAASLACCSSPKTNDTDAGTGAKADAGAAATAPSDDLKAVAEVESNDTPQTAQHIAESSRVSAQINPVQPATRPDEDWFLIAPTAVPQDVSVALLPQLPGPIEVEVYDRDRNRIMARTVAGAPADGGVAPRNLVFPQVRVRDQLYVRIAAPRSSGKYTLELKLTPPDPDREAEPNDKPIDATPLPLDHPMRGLYETEGDQDFYVVELELDAGVPGPPVGATAAPVLDAGGDGGAVVDAGTAPPAAAVAVAADAGGLSAPPTGLLRIDVTGVPGLRHALTVYDENQVPFATFTSRELGGPVEVRDLPVHAGMSHVTLLLESAPIRKRRPASDQPYTVTVRREAAPPDVELEPNDTLETATPIATHRVGWLSPQGDVDVYKLHVDAPTRVHAVLSALERVDTELQVVDPDAAAAEKFRTVLKVNEGGPKEPEVIPALTLAPGDHYFRVLAASHKVGDKWVRDQEDADQTYSLDLALSPDDGAFEREPNDSAATATPIAVDKPLSGYLFPSKDVDVYRLDLSAQPVAAAAVIRVTGVTRVPVWLEVHEASGPGFGELLNSADPGKPGAEAVVHQKLEPGVYFLVIRAHPQAKTGAPTSDPETAYKVSVELE